jgi:hypothetical protein
MCAMTKDLLFKLSNGRSVKIQVDQSPDTRAARPRVLIKDPHQQDYQPVISTIHPQYWKYKGLDQMQAVELELLYSGLSKRHIRKFLQDMKNGFPNSISD